MAKLLGISFVESVGSQAVPANEDVSGVHQFCGAFADAFGSLATAAAAVVGKETQQMQITRDSGHFTDRISFAGGSDND